MTEQRRTGLKELQKLDINIREARQRIQDFDPLFAEVEEPALVLESELGTSRTRLKEMMLEERRLESSTEERKDRLKRLDERVASVRNLREEAAVTAELEMVRRALQNDEQEALTLMDQVRKGEERLAELEESSAEANALVEPQREELITQRAKAKKDLEDFEREREQFAGGIDPAELRIYDAIRRGGRWAAVSELTEDGACGNCFGVVPLQFQNEIRHGDSLIRCEACGVILAAPEPVVEGAEGDSDDEPEVAPDSDETEPESDGDDADADADGDEEEDAAESAASPDEAASDAEDQEKEEEEV